MMATAQSPAPPPAHGSASVPLDKRHSRTLRSHRLPEVNVGAVVTCSDRTLTSWHNPGTRSRSRDTVRAKHTQERVSRLRVVATAGLTKTRLNLLPPGSPFSDREHEFVQSARPRTSILYFVVTRSISGTEIDTAIAFRRKATRSIY